MKVLMIVESPVKARKFRGYFPDFDIVATVGHLRELPPKEMGVSPPEHKPQYVTIAGKSGVEKAILGAAKKADVIYVATDPDREGEAIGGHVVNLLGKQHKDKISRITYDEISKAAITKAIQNNRAIDWNLVKAQEARRVLDRYVGYLTSPELTLKFNQHGYNNRLSSGRVQSVAVRLTVERQCEIALFKPVEHFCVMAVIQKSNILVPCFWKPVLKQGELMTDRQRAEQVVANTNALIFLSETSKTNVITPPKPLTTSTYVQLMADKLKMTVKQSMNAAQRLHEAGLITYHRTDSPQMSADFIQVIRAFAGRNRFPLPEIARAHKASANAQAGHECLRVTDMDMVNPRAAGIEDEQLRHVYQWIWQITLESQLANGINIDTLLEFENGRNDKFVAKASVVSVAGWRGIADKFLQRGTESPSENDVADEETILDKLPVITQGETLPCETIEMLIKKTKAPLVYTEKTLVQKLEALGIGRPSTFASIIERIVEMNYVERQGKNLKLVPTLLGTATVFAQKKIFSFLEYKYTAQLEDALDQIAKQNANYWDVVDAAYQTLVNEIEQFRSEPFDQDTMALISTLHLDLPGTESNPEKINGTAKVVNFTKSSRHTSSAKPTSSSTDKKPKTYSSSPKGKPGETCPMCNKGILSVKKLAGGENKGRPFVGCSGFPSCKFFNWVQ